MPSLKLLMQTCSFCLSSELSEVALVVHDHFSLDVTDSPAPAELERHQQLVAQQLNHVGHASFAAVR